MTHPSSRAYVRAGSGAVGGSAGVAERADEGRSAAGADAASQPSASPTNPPSREPAAAIPDRRTVRRMAYVSGEDRPVRSASDQVAPAFPAGRSRSARARSRSDPKRTPAGQAASQARQPRQRSMCSANAPLGETRPSAARLMRWTRPRGESFSSRSTRYVGHAGRQSPQCTHVSRSGRPSIKRAATDDSLSDRLGAAVNATASALGRASPLRRERARRDRPRVALPPRRSRGGPHRSDRARSSSPRRSSTARG